MNDQCALWVFFRSNVCSFFIDVVHVSKIPINKMEPIINLSIRQKDGACIGNCIFGITPIQFAPAATSQRHADLQKSRI